MNKAELNTGLNPGCPIRNILARVCTKWSLLVLHTLYHTPGQTLRFKELQRSIPDISQKMLTSTLRTLEEDGYIRRTVYAVVPPKVEYTLTERANSLFPHLMTLCEWACSHFDAIIRDRERGGQ